MRCLQRKDELHGFCTVAGCFDRLYISLTTAEEMAQVVSRGIGPYTAGLNGPQMRLETKNCSRRPLTEKDKISAFEAKQRKVHFCSPSTFFEESSHDAEDTGAVFALAAGNSTIGQSPVDGSTPSPEIIRRSTSQCDPLDYDQWAQLHGGCTAGIRRSASVPTAPLCEAERCAARILRYSPPLRVAATGRALQRVIDAAASNAARTVAEAGPRGIGRLGSL